MSFFQRNEGTLDRVLRALGALVLILLGYYAFSGVVSIILYVIAGILVFTAVTGFCALYPLLHISTFRSEKKSSPQTKVN